MALPSPSALGIRTRADTLHLAIVRQQKRCTEPIPGGPLGPESPQWKLGMIERSTDADFLVIVLWRFLRFARRVANGPFATTQVTAELANFEGTVSHLREIRDTQEHFIEYSSGAGYRQQRGEQPSGWGYGLNPGSVILTYGPYMLNLGEATEAAYRLHRAIRAAVDELALQDVHGGPETVIIPQP